MKLEDTVEEFLSNRTNYGGYKKQSVEKLLRSRDNSLLKIYNKNSPGEGLEVDKLEGSIKESVQAHSQKKDTAIYIYKKFLAFLASKHDIQADPGFPPVPVSVTFERIMFIAKYLQVPENKVEDLQDILWVSQRTVEDDLARLRGNRDPIQVGGKRFVLEDLVRRRGRVTLSSTVHPLFLTCNLTQVLVNLKGLRQVGQDPAYRGYAETLARSIWGQLSGYAKERIKFVTRELLPDDYQWYLGLEDSGDNSFTSEVRCSNTGGAGCLIDCIKNRKACCIEYKGEGGQVIFLENCRVEGYDGDTYTVNSGGESIKLKGGNILRSSYTPEEIL